MEHILAAEFTTRGFDAKAAVERAIAPDATVTLDFALNRLADEVSAGARTIEAWQSRTPIAVIEGDQQTSRDANRVRAAGAPAISVSVVDWGVLVLVF